MDFREIYDASSEGNLDIVKLKVKEYEDQDLDYLNWGLAMLDACRGTGNLDIIKLMWEQGVNSQHLNWSIYYAATRNYEKVVEFLMSKGGDLDPIILIQRFHDGLA